MQFLSLSQLSKQRLAQSLHFTSPVKFVSVCLSGGALSQQGLQMSERLDELSTQGLSAG